MRPFQVQHHAFSTPGGRNLYFSLVPSDPSVAFSWLEPERNFYVSRLAILGVLRRGEPGFIHDVTGPFGIDGYIVADALSRKGPGQAEFAAQGAAAPFLFDTDVRPVQLETPPPGK